jgi:hypothetical protein
VTAARFTALAALLLVGWEWMFYASKPSILSGSGLEVYLCAFLLPGLLLAILVSLPVVAAGLLSRRLGTFFGALIGGILLGVASLFVVDSVLYGGLGVGSLYTDGALRLGCAVIFAVLCVRWGWIGRFPARRIDLAYWTGLLFLFGAVFIWRFPTLTLRDFETRAGKVGSPHIILLGSDGLDPSEMGVYNSSLQNTPNLVRLKQDMLVCDAAYANANRSAGSVVSMLTGRLPFSTRVVNYPDLLLPGLAYDHLPGILKAAGYYTFESSMRGYADSFDLNLRDGFIEANGRLLQRYEFPVLARYREVFASVEYNFGLTILNDTLNRIKHLLFIDRFQSIFKLVKTGQGLREIDQAGMRRLKELLVDVGAKQPVFAHMHLLGTHGPGFDSVSVGGTAYQNAIADFDGYIGEFFKFLEGRGILKNTLVIIYSDHDSKNSSVPKIPMLLYLPGGEFAGEHRSECQLLDVAPTVLQAAGLSVPSYMEGAALQRPPSQPLDIYIASDVEEVEVWDYKKPPFYQFGAASVISCGVITEVKFPSIKTTVNGAPQCTSAFVGEGAAVKLSEMVSNEKIG